MGECNNKNLQRKMSFKYILLSFWDITRHIILSQKGDVLFFYPQHFNRSKNGTNLFFDSMLEACEKNGVRYKVIEEPDGGTDKARNRQAIKGDFLYLLVIVLRKIAHLLYPSNDVYQNERPIARWFNIITLGKLRYRRYVTISGSMQTLFVQMSPGCKALDIQHGILDNHNPGWFTDEGKLKQCFHNSSIQWMVWGKGYKECFTKGEQDMFEGRVHVVGYPIKNVQIETMCSRDSKRYVLVSLQLTKDGNKEWTENYMEMLSNTLSELKGCNVKVLLKHHPRFNNAVDLSPIVSKYDFVEYTTESLDALSAKILIQVTYHSTTAYEYAQIGIPSYFIHSPQMHRSIELFYDTYHYPIYENQSLSDVIERLQNEQNYQADSGKVKKWYKDFYSDFDENCFLNLIK